MEGADDYRMLPDAYGDELTAPGPLGFGDSLTQPGPLGADNLTDIYRRSFLRR
jgi:hypothetical protein